MRKEACMKEKVYFYFADPKSFSYTIWVRLLFSKHENRYINRRDKSVWREQNNYFYFGDSTKVLMRERDYSFEFMFALFLNSENNSNIFGSVNYMLNKYHSDFIREINAQAYKPEHSENINIYLKYFA